MAPMSRKGPQARSQLGRGNHKAAGVSGVSWRERSKSGEGPLAQERTDPVLTDQPDSFPGEAMA